MEWSYSISGPNWRVNGRADFVSHVDNILNIDDFKYGYSIVEPDDNWTLIAHAIGYCDAYGVVPDRITLTIHQPRASHRNGKVRFVNMTYDELMAKMQTLSAVLQAPSNMLQTGPACYKCPSFLTCPARQDAEINAIEISRVAYNAHVDNIDLADRLEEIQRAQQLLKQSAAAYEELALHRIVKGEIVRNYTVENDLTNRTFHSYVTPELLDTLYGDKGICKRVLPTLKDAEAAYGKDAVATLTTRHSKGNKLVRTDANKKGKRLFGG